MKQLIFLIFLITSPLWAYEFKLNKNDIDYINKSPKKSFILNRIEKYQTLKEKVKDYELIKKLSYVNSFINKILPARDISTASSIDYWATPKEFLLQGHGDCEDYVIAKYFALKHLGIPTSKMFLSYVRLEGAKDAHMVLTYFETPTSEPLILDSIRKIIFPASKRSDLKPIYNFNPNILDKGGKTAAHKKWDVVLKNFRENKI